MPDGSDKTPLVSGEAVHPVGLPAQSGVPRQGQLKIVQVVYENPLVNGSGGDLRNRAVAAALDTMGEVHVVSVQDAQPEGRVYPKRKRSFVELRLDPAVVDQIVHETLALAPDIVVIEGVLIADVMERLAAADCVLILDMHNVESVLQHDIDKAKFGWAAWIRRSHRWRAARAADARLAQMADGVWVCSDGDANILAQLIAGPAQIDIIPNPIPDWCHCTPRRTEHPPGTPTALFVGHLGYQPNVEACRRLIDRTLPAIHQNVKETKLVICGRTPRAELVALAANRPNVDFIADPEVLDTYYNNATAVLIPLSQGGGTRLKVLEAMARGVPVIATNKAVEGLNLVDGETFLRAETDKEFASAFAKILSDQNTARRLVLAGTAFVTQNHGPGEIATRVSTAVRHALKR